MHTTLEDARALAAGVRDGLAAGTAAETVLCPPFVSLEAVAQTVRGSRLRVGAQNCHPEDAGAFTGEVSAAMLAPLCQYVIVGHSERRAMFGDTDEMVSNKVRAALRHGLTPIICVGDTLQENETGRAEEVVARQIRAALAGLRGDHITGVVIAYEPVWAIGTGRPATASAANAVIGDIRQLLGRLYSPAAADRVRIQYGGSVTAANAEELLAQPEIDGALVGSASLRAREFIAIVHAADRPLV